MKNLSDLEKILRIEFNNLGLLQEAFTHRSFLNEKAVAEIRHNERLEFLGDAVLELSVTEFLFNKFPEKAEGELTALRASLVNSQMLFKAADKLKMENYLRLSKGEAKEKGKGKQFILANALEALIGAIYLDQGYKSADSFVKKHICFYIQNILEKKLWRDSKSLFQEKAQEIESVTPVYKVLKESGPDHKKYFVIGAYLEDELIAKGEGFSKHEAEIKAAQNALEKKSWED